MQSEKLHTSTIRLRLGSLQTTLDALELRCGAAQTGSCVCHTWCQMLRAPSSELSTWWPWITPDTED